MNRDLLLFLIGQIHFKVDKHLVQELSAHGMPGLSPSHGEILGFLSACGQMKMKDMAELIGKDKSTLTVLIKKLIDLGYIVKFKSAEDSRVSLIDLTEKGKAVKDDILTISSELRKKAYSTLIDEERDTLFNLLMKINKNM